MCALLALSCGSDPSPRTIARELEEVARALGIEVSRLEVVAAVGNTSRSAPYPWALKVAETGTDRVWRVTGPARTGVKPPPPGGVCGRIGLHGIGDGRETRWLLVRYRDGGPDDPSTDPPSSLAALTARTLLRHAEVPGFVGEAVDAYGPFVVDEIRSEAIAELCRRDDLLFAGPYRKPQHFDAQEVSSAPTIVESLARTRTDRLHQANVAGTGLRVAVMELGRPDFPAACYDFAADCCETVGVAAWPAGHCVDPTICIQDAAAGPDGHIADVMALVGSRLPPDGSGECAGRSDEGYAPAAALLVANAEATDAAGNPVSDWVAASRWAVSQGARIVTMSFHPHYEQREGALSSRDVFFDWLVVDERVSVFASAGNEGHLEDSAFASGKGYNFLGVANAANEEGVGRCDTEISTESSWRNPSTWHRDRELPEITMPGSSYRVFGRSFGGTSAATPAVAAVAALLMEARSELERWPEAIRALLLAGADFQLADRWDWKPTPICDGKDGVGLVNAYESYRAALAFADGGPHGHDYGRITHADFRGPGDLPPSSYGGPLGIEKRRTLERSWTIQAAAGERVRAAFAWNSNVKSPNGPSLLDLDADLIVVAPDGSRTLASATFDNSYELAVFDAVDGGEYVLEVVGYDVPADLDTFFGVAWVSTTVSCGQTAEICG